MSQTKELRKREDSKITTTNMLELSCIMFSTCRSLCTIVNLYLLFYRTWMFHLLYISSSPLKRINLSGVKQLWQLRTTYTKIEICSIGFSVMGTRYINVRRLVNAFTVGFDQRHRWDAWIHILHNSNNLTREVLKTIFEMCLPMALN